ILWDMAGRLWRILARLLEGLAGWGWELPTVGLGGEAGLAPLACGLVLLALPAGLRLRRLALLLLISVCLTRPPPPPPGSFAATVLDVGQGLAVVVRTARHTLLYDTGPRWWSGADAGALVVVPALRRMGVDHLDALVVSHGDSDHVGGLAAVSAAFAIETWHAPADAVPDLEAAPRVCDTAASWTWDGVVFRLLAAVPRAGASRNDRSCVVMIESAAGRLLLTGDIERTAEQGLVAAYGAALRADVMVVPHHGSATSSSAAFLAAVAPRYAIVPAGYANRYRMPHAAVVARYRAAGVALFDTAEDGAVSIAWRGRAAVVRTERSRRRGFWTARDSD
ncbi:MAG: ComEC/Rec2 family competence protein, partial [Gammaproteobacteria bacterium]